MMLEIIFAMIIVAALLIIFFNKEAMVPIIVIFVIGLTGLGYIFNAVSLIECDFKEPFKEEFIRGTGVFIAPLGAILGYIDIEDGENEQNE